MDLKHGPWFRSRHDEETQPIKDIKGQTINTVVWSLSDGGVSALGKGPSHEPEGLDWFEQQDSGQHNGRHELG